MQVKGCNEIRKAANWPIIHGKHNIFRLQTCCSGRSIRGNVGKDRSPAGCQSQACCQRWGDVLCTDADRHVLHPAVFAKALVVEIDNGGRNGEAESLTAASSARSEERRGGKEC